MIVVLAGVNGAGKSSIGGSALREAGQEWFNPDEFAQTVSRNYPDRPMADINSLVWREGLNRLKAAIQTDSDYAFETTLGGSTITNTLLDAVAIGVNISLWYCGLVSPELHIERVAARVARGGHDIPTALIQSRYRSSMHNLCRLAPGLYRLAVYDNSEPLSNSGKPNVRLLLQANRGRVTTLAQPMPNWAKPVAAVCLQQARR